MSYYLGDNTIQKIIQIKRIVNKYSAKSELSACLELTCGIANFVNFNYYNGHNIILGTPASSSLIGASNIAIGYQATPYNITSNCNIAIGYHDTQPNTNIAIGYQAMRCNTNKILPYTNTMQSCTTAIPADIKTATMYFNNYLNKNGYTSKYLSKLYKQYNSIKELIGLGTVYYDVPNERKQHKYKRSYNYDSYRWESEDNFMNLEQHDAFVQLLFIKRFMEKYTYQSSLAAPLELSHMIFEFIDKRYVPIIITTKPYNIVRICDGVSSYYC